MKKESVITFVFYGSFISLAQYSINIVINRKNIGRFLAVIGKKVIYLQQKIK